MQDNHTVYEAVSRFTNDRASSSLTRGRLDILTFDMPQFEDNRKRKIRVWLPDNYKQEDSETKYPVMYMHDAQNLFDAYTSFMGEWEVDESLGKMIDAGYGGAIVVGIDNGESLRFNELSPPWERNTIGSTYIGDPSGDKYAAFITETVKPYIDSRYNTKSDARFTGIGGSSMGGVMSLYMALGRPDIFGYAMIFSPALHLYTDDVIDSFTGKLLAQALPSYPKFFLYSGGTYNGPDAYAPYNETLIKEFPEKLYEALASRGYPEAHIRVHIDNSKEHSEEAWAEYFPVAYAWLTADSYNHE